MSNFLLLDVSEHWRGIDMKKVITSAFSAWSLATYALIALSGGVMLPATASAKSGDIPCFIIIVTCPRDGGPCTQGPILPDLDCDGEIDTMDTV